MKGKNLFASRRMLRLLCLAFWGYTGTVQAQTDPERLSVLVTESLVHGKAYDWLYRMCKSIGPRLSGSVGAARAVDSTARWLKEAGADTVYLQPCQVPHWERGKPATARVMIPGKYYQDLRVCALGNSVGTGDTVVEGEVLELSSPDMLRSINPETVKGKIVFFNQPMDPARIRTFEAYGAAGASRRSGAARAAQYGARAVLVRSLSSNVDAYPHTGVTQYNDSFPRIPALAVATEDAEWMHRALKENGRLSIAVTSGARMLPDVPSYNVIAELKGTVYPDEIITVGGHLDSWDLAEGAHDDGAGCVQSIEIIRLFHDLGWKPKRTIRVVLFMNEENGSRGSKAYHAAVKEKKERVIFALESDAGGFTPRGFSVEASERALRQLREWAPLFAPYGSDRFEAGGSGADIGALKEEGTVLVGLMPDSQRYFDVHHAATDVVETVSKRELHLSAAMMAALLWLVSENGIER